MMSQQTCKQELPLDAVLHIWEEGSKEALSMDSSLKHSAKLHWLLGSPAWNQLQTAKLQQQTGDERPVVINRFGGSWTDSSLRSHLQRLGIPAAKQAAWGRRAKAQSARYVRTVTFWVNQCDIAACGIAFIQPNGGLQVQQPIQDWLKPPYRRLARLAIRAAYALGWDTLQVTVQGAPQEHMAEEAIGGVMDELQEGDVILQCSPISRLLVPEWVWDRYIAQLSAQGAALMPVDKPQCMKQPAVQYGLDMEYVLLDRERERVVSASRFLPYSGIAGCDAVRIQGQVQYPLVELRPRPSAQIEDLVQHLQAAMITANQAIQRTLAAYKKHKPHYVNSVKWCAGSLPHPLLPIGGHVHLSGVPLTPELSRALDVYVALPVSLIEAKSTTGASRRPSYGLLGDIRLQDHDGDGGFEYRTLPSFAYSPQLAMEVLSLFAATVEHYPNLTHQSWVMNQVQYSFIAGEKERYRELALNAVQELSAHTEGARQYWIRQFYERVQRGWTWKESEDISSAWL